MAFRTSAIAIVGIGLLSFLGPWKGTVLAGAKGLIGADRDEAVPGAEIEPQSVQSLPDVAPAEFIQQGPENVLDRFANTAWATRWLARNVPGDVVATSDGTCAPSAITDTVLVFTFAQPTDLRRVGILGGRNADDPLRNVFSRPRIVELKVDDRCEQIELDDKGEVLTHDYSHDNVERLELRILDLFRDPEQSNTVEITEVIFERKR